MPLGFNCFIAERLGKSQHVTKRFLVEATSKLGGQLSPQRGDNVFAILGAFELENVATDTLTDVPIKCDEAGIDRARDILASGKNHLAYIAKQGARKC